MYERKSPMIKRQHLGDRKIADNLKLEAVLWYDENEVRVSVYEVDREGYHSVHRHYAWLNFYKTKAIPKNEHEVQIILEFAELQFKEEKKLKNN